MFTVKGCLVHTEAPFSEGSENFSGSIPQELLQNLVVWPLPDVKMSLQDRPLGLRHPEQLVGGQREGSGV